jgi:hypothetical protein
LGEILPAKVEEGTWLSQTKSLNGWGEICGAVSYDKWEKHEGSGKLLIKHVHKISQFPYSPTVKSKLTEADARAKMLIYLLENKLI